MIEGGQCNLSEESLSTCRVDKKAAQQTESGSNNVSYGRVSKGSSQGCSLPSNSISSQGNQKKNSKTKADIEIPNETLVSSRLHSGIIPFIPFCNCTMTRHMPTDILVIIAE